MLRLPHGRGVVADPMVYEPTAANYHEARSEDPVRAVVDRRPALSEGAGGSRSACRTRACWNRKSATLFTTARASGDCKDRAIAPPILQHGNRQAKA